MKYDNLFQNNNKIMIIGDVMIDTYLTGKVERISPEAPVPVVDIDNKTNKLGGAANVALNIKELGSTPIICSVIGNDERSKDLELLLWNNEMLTRYIYRTDRRKTTNKIQILSGKFSKDEHHRYSRGVLR